MQTISVVIGDAPATLVSQRVPRGTTYKLAIQVKDENGDNLDLTGATVIFAVKATPEVNNFLIRKSLNGTGESDFPNGKIVIEVIPSDTELITAGWYYWGISVKQGSGEINELARGDFTLYESVATAPVN